jgi:hypothetical protein
MAPFFENLMHLAFNFGHNILGYIDYCLTECDAMCFRFGYLHPEYRGGTFPRDLSIYLTN